MKSCFVLAIVLVMYTNGCCKETEDDGVYNSLSNLTLEEDDDDDDFSNFMRPQQFTWGTLLGLLVASVVVVIGSFLVLWRVCCDVEMRVTREVVMEPLKSISQAVAGGQSGSISGQALLGRRASTGVLEIA